MKYDPGEDHYVVDENSDPIVSTPETMSKIATYARAGDPMAKSLIRDSKGIEAGALGPLDVVVFGASLKATQATAPFFRFASDELLRDHFEKHGAEFGSKTAAQYLRAAVSFVSSSSERGTVSFTRANRDRIIYRIATNEFAVATRVRALSERISRLLEERHTMLNNFSE